jgi:Mrp family chromosome partitioning ATPase
VITISDFINALRSPDSASAVEVKFIHPALYVIYVDISFEHLTDDVRDELICRRHKINREDLAGLRTLGAIEIVFLTPDERAGEFSFIDETEQDESWLPWFDPARWDSYDQIGRQPIPDGETRILHFYGYKGGQARSTVLVLFAKYLSDQGFRVLILDADVEAPSIDTMLEIATEEPNATLMGLCGWGDKVQPISEAYVGKSGGKVDVLACRPKSSQYDMDFAAFLTNIALNTKVLKTAARRLDQFINDSSNGSPRYDVVLIDHRTGVAPSVLPLMEVLPGSAVIFVRPDGSSRNIENSKIFDTLLSFDTINPGVFVSFSLDPFETVMGVQGNKGVFIERLLESLSDAYSRAGGELIDPSELDQNWLLWHHDRALLADRLPAITELSKANVDALQQLRDVLSLATLHSNKPLVYKEPVLTRSGATDDGWFIRTPDVARLFSLDNKLLYIFGRKGTGKTRLVRELYGAGLGEPLLVASDYDEAGIPSLSGSFATILRLADNDFERFWWMLLRIGIDANSRDQQTLI